MKTIPDYLFLLYGGTSCDGRGPFRFEGRTADIDRAITHAKKVEADPYSVGFVSLITKSGQRTMNADRLAELKLHLPKK